MTMANSDDKERPVHWQAGRLNRVAVVFSCPGRHEEAAGRPAARSTGKNLEILLELLAGALGRDDLHREEVTITNAWPKVEYRAKTGRTEASEREVCAPENVERLRRELDEVTELVIFCGRKARAVAPLLRLKHRPSFVFISHPGLRGLSMIHSDACGDPIMAVDGGLRPGTGGVRRGQSENTRRRLAVLAASICRQLQERQSAVQPKVQKPEDQSWPDDQS